MKVSETLRAAAINRGLQLRELSALSGVDETVLSRFTRGAGLRSENLDRLAEALDLELRPRDKARRRGTQRGK